MNSDLTVQRLEFSSYGDLGSLHWVDGQLLEFPPRGQVRIKMRYLGINPLDWKIIAGEQRWLTGRLPRGFGCEGSGIVVDPGRSKILRAGQPVAVAVNPLTSFVGVTVVDLPGQAIIPLPATINLDEAAALPVGLNTAWRALGTWRPRTDDLSLVVGATGAVGNLLTQVLGQGPGRLHVLTNPEKFAASGLRADRIFDYRSLSALSLPYRYRRIFDCHGGLVDRRVANILAPGGVLCHVSVANRDIPRSLLLPFQGVPNRLLIARPSVALVSRGITQLQRMGVRPLIGAVYPRGAILEAIESQIEGRHFGKILVELGDQT